MTNIQANQWDEEKSKTCIDGMCILLQYQYFSSQLYLRSQPATVGRKENKGLVPGDVVISDEKIPIEKDQPLR